MLTPGEEQAILRLLRTTELSCGEIAKRVGVGRSTVQTIKNGKRRTGRVTKPAIESFGPDCRGKGCGRCVYCRATNTRRAGRA